MSVGDDGRQLNADNGIYGAAISADGRYVTFISSSPDVVAGDRNGVADVFVRDRTSTTTRRVDVSTQGAEANDAACCTQAISDDGRYVAFMSAATNLVPGDTNGWMDVFVNDLAFGATERASVGAGGQANAQSGVSGLSSHGTVVVFQSAASNLVADDTNGAGDIFVRDLAGPYTEQVSAAVEPQPYVIRAARSPRPPRAGRLYSTTILVGAGGHAVDTARVTARATVRHRVVLLVRNFFAESAAHVIWRLPRNARNNYLTATIRVRTAGGVVGSTWIAIVR